MKTIALILTILALFTNSYSQKLVAKNGHIWFYSHTPAEDIEAHNHQVVSILDPATGDLQFSLLVKSFEFEKKLTDFYYLLFRSRVEDDFIRMIFKYQLDETERSIRELEELKLKINA